MAGIAKTANAKLMQTLRERQLPLSFRGRRFDEWRQQELYRAVRGLHSGEEVPRHRAKLYYIERLLHHDGQADGPIRSSAVSSAGSSHLPTVVSPLVPSDGPTQVPPPAVHGQTTLCTACLDEVPSNVFRAVPSDSECSHKTMDICSSCFAHHIRTSATSSIIDAIACPQTGCVATLSYTQMHQHAPHELFERYDMYITQKVVSASSDYLVCSSPSCQLGGFIDDNMSYMTCHCGRRTCVACKTEWHPDLTHEDNMAAVRAEEELTASRKVAQTKEEKQSQQYICRSTKACPQCGIAIAKSMGCDHMEWSVQVSLNHGMH